MERLVVERLGGQGGRQGRLKLALAHLEPGPAGCGHQGDRRALLGGFGQNCFHRLDGAGDVTSQFGCFAAAIVDLGRCQPVAELAELG